MKLLTFFLLINSIVFSQNKSYQLFSDSILPLSESDYQLSKSLFQKLRKEYQFDPGLINGFLMISLENNDVKFFKKEIVKQIKTYGYYYDYSDTSGKALDNSLNLLIKEHQLPSWLAKKSQKYYPIWLKHHPIAIEIEKQLSSAMLIDQFIRYNSDFYLSQKFKYEIIADSIKYNEYKKLIYENYNKVDLQNIYTIRELYRLNGNYAINNFDNGLVNEIVDFIIFHNLKEGNLDVPFQILFPFIEQAYLDGKINDKNFRTYDFYLNKHKGYQYYGTLGEEVPFENKEKSMEVIKRLNL